MNSLTDDGWIPSPHEGKERELVLPEVEPVDVDELVPVWAEVLGGGAGSLEERVEGVPKLLEREQK